MTLRLTTFLESPRKHVLPLLGFLPWKTIMCVLPWLLYRPVRVLKSWINAHLLGWTRVIQLYLHCCGCSSCKRTQTAFTWNLLGRDTGTWSTARICWCALTCTLHKPHFSMSSLLVNDMATKAVVTACTWVQWAQSKRGYWPNPHWCTLLQGEQTLLGPQQQSYTSEMVLVNVTVQLPPLSQTSLNFCILALMN